MGGLRFRLIRDRKGTCTTGAALKLAGNGSARVLFRRVGRVGDLVADRPAPALARHPGGSPGPAGVRDVFADSPARGRAGRPARERRIAQPFTYTWLRR